MFRRFSYKILFVIGPILSLGGFYIQNPTSGTKRAWFLSCKHPACGGLDLREGKARATLGPIRSKPQSTKGLVRVYGLGFAICLMSMTYRPASSTPICRSASGASLTPGTHAKFPTGGRRWAEGKTRGERLRGAREVCGFSSLVK